MKTFLAWWHRIVHEMNRGVQRGKEFFGPNATDLEEIELALQKEERYLTPPGEGQGILHVRDAWTFWLIGMLAALLAYFVFQSLDILYLILAGFILAMATESVITRLQRRFSRGFSIMLTYILLLVFVLSGLVIVVPFVVQQMADIANLFLDKINSFQSALQQHGLAAVIAESRLPGQFKESLLQAIQSGNLVESAQESLLENMSQIVSLGSDYISNAGSLAVSIVTSFFSAFVQISIVFVVAVFFSIEKDEVIHFLARMSGRVQHTELKLKKLYTKLGYWLQGQLFLCLIIGVMVGVGLIVLSRFGIDIPNKFTLALIAGLTEFIPYIGPFMGMLPALLLGALSYGWVGMGGVLILYWIIQQSENNILVPAIMSQTLGVSPLLIFLCMVLGASLFGILGIILAVPFAVIMNILFESYTRRRTLSHKPR